MDDAELERIIKAIQTPLGGSTVPGAWRVSRPPARARTRMSGTAKCRKPETEVRRLQKAIRTSFCNSPHKKKYWMALLEMYAKPEWRRETVREGRREDIARDLQ